jgi:hypothetical protein
MAAESVLNRLPMPVVIAGVVIVVGVAVWAGVRSFGPDPQIVESKANNDFITRMAIKSGGDINKLSSDERSQLDKLTKGDSETVLRMHPSSAMGRFMQQQQGGQTAPSNP